mgnify:FL=1
MTPATCIVGIVILIAAVYMFKHVRGLFKGTTGCSCCDGGAGCCSSEKNTSEGDGKPPCCSGK